MITRAFSFVALAAIAIVNAVATSAFLHSTRSQCVNSRQTLPLASTSKETDTSNIGCGNTKSSGFWDRLETILFAPLEMKIEDNNGSGDEDPRLLLAEWRNLWEETTEIFDANEDLVNRNATASATAAEESLTNFLEVWARMTLPNDKGLTTPVSPTTFLASNGNLPEVTSGENIDGDNHFHNSSSMKLIFRPPKRYLSYKEQKSMEKNGAIPDRKGAKVDAWSPGGVEIQVTITTTVTRVAIERKIDQKSILGVTARRCNIDGDTVIKKTSERAIVRRLENAIRIWKKSNHNKN